MKNKILLLLILISSAAYGQKDSLTIIGFVGMRGIWQTGNLEQLSLIPNGKIQVRNTNNYAEVLMNYHFLKVNGFNVKNDFWVNSLYQHKLHRTFFPSLHANAGFANSFSIDHSIMVGIGGGVNFIQHTPSKYFQLHLYPAYMGFQWQGQRAIQSAALGTMTRTNLPLYKQLSLRWELSTYHSIQESGFWGGGNLFQFNLAIIKNLMVNISHQSYYNNQSIEIIKNLNTQMLFGFQYNY